MPAKSDPRDTAAARTAPVRFALLAFFALILVALRPSAVRAQADVLCGDLGDREVRSLRFVGNTTFSDDELSARVAVTPSSITRRTLSRLGINRGGSRRCFPEGGLAPDVASLKLFYRNNGFFDTKIDTVVAPARNGSVSVTFRIEEGPPIILDSLNITGLDAAQTAAIQLDRLQLHVGGRFGPQPLAVDQDSILSRLRNAGFARAEVFQSYDIQASEHRATVDLTVQPGPHVRFGNIAVHNVGANDKPGEIKDTVIQGLLGFKTGYNYSDRALDDAQRNLYNLGAFRHVNVAVDTLWAHGDSLADVQVDLREDYLHEVTQEEGWRTLDCFNTTTQYTDKNFRDKAQRLDLTVRFSKLGYGHPTESRFTRNLCYRYLLDADSIGSSKLNDYIGATIRNPTLFNFHWVPSFSIYTERRGAYLAYLRSTDIGGSYFMTRDVARDTPLRLGFTLEAGNTQAEPAVLCGIFLRCDQTSQDEVQARLRMGVVSAALQRSSTDNPVAPRTGYVAGVEFRHSAPYTMSDQLLTFTKGTTDDAWYHGITARSTFAARIRAGYVYGGSEVQTPQGTATLPPPQERLYAGGAQSVRGFGENQLGPQVYLLDANAFDTVRVSGNAVTGDSTFYFVARPGARQQRNIPGGGNLALVLNFELRIRDPFFPDLLEYAPFVDAGQVFVQQVDKPKLNWKTLATTPGLSIRYFSPVGPVQLNVGYNGYAPRPGPAYFAPPVDVRSSAAPLICVTAPGVAPIPVTRLANGQLVQPESRNCPASFSPPGPTNFFSRMQLSVSIGSGF